LAQLAEPSIHVDGDEQYQPRDCDQHEGNKGEQAHEYAEERGPPEGESDGEKDGRQQRRP